MYWTIEKTSRPNTTFLGKYLNVCLLAGGIFERKYRKLELLYLGLLIFLFATTVLGEIVGLMNHITSVTAATEILMDASILLFLIGTFTCVRSSGQTFRHFLVQLHHGHYRAAVRSTEHLFKKRLISISPFFISMITAVLTIIVPILCSSELDLDNKNLYLAPFWFECPKEDVGENPRFPITWFCFRIDTLREFLSVNIFVSSFIFWGFIPYSTLFTFCVFIVTLLKEHTKDMERRIDGMEKRLQIHRPDQRRRTMRKFDEIAELIEIIKYHQFVQKIIFHVIPFLKKVSILVLISCFIIPILAIFMSINERGTASNLIFRIRVTCITFNGFYLFSTACVVAHNIMEVNERVAEAVYNTSWYCRSIDYRKMMIMFLLRLRVPFVIKAMGAYTMGLHLLKSFLQKMYATLNIALSMYSDFQNNSK